MVTERKSRNFEWWSKAAGVLFAIYLASFGVVLWADNEGKLSRPPGKTITVTYAPLIWFYSLVSRGLK